MRKSSKSITLVLGATVSAMVLAGCDPAPDDQPTEIGRMFSDAQACEAIYDKDTCASAFRQAQSEHAVTAPRYSTMDSCATVSPDGCSAVRVTNPNGTFQDVFVPLMAGVMIGNMLNGPKPLYYGAPDKECRSGSDCRSTSGGSAARTVYTGNGVVVGRSAGGGSTIGSSLSTTASRAAPVIASPSTVARGGFGASAAGHAGGGS